MQAISTPTQAIHHPLAEDVATFLFYLLKSSSPDLFRAMAEHELSLTQVKVLHMLEEKEQTECSIKAIADQFAMSMAAMSRCIDGLHQRGLVERREDTDDRRIKRVRISPPGRDLVGQLTETRLSQLDHILSTLTEPQRKRLSAALDPILARDEVAACRPKGLSQ